MRRGRLRRTLWLFPATFALHVAEEAPRFTSWVNRHASDRFTQRDFVRNNALGLVLTLGSTLLTARTDRRPIFLVYYSAVLTQQALYNPLFHAGTTVAYRTYSPGLLTSLLFLPVWYRLTRLGLRDGLLTPRSTIAASTIGGLIHAAAVAQQVYFVELRCRRRPAIRSSDGSHCRGCRGSFLQVDQRDANLFVNGLAQVLG